MEVQSSRLLLAAEEREKKGKELEAKKRYDTSAQNFYPSRIFTDTCILTLISPGKCSFCVNPPSGMPSPSVATLACGSAVSAS